MDHILDACTQLFLSEPFSGMECLTQQVLRLLDKTPLDHDVIKATLNYLCSISDHCKRLRNEPSELLTDGLLAQEALKAFKAVDAKFQDLITKQVPSLNMDLLRSTIGSLSALLSSSLSWDGIDATREMIPEGVVGMICDDRIFESNHVETRITLIESSWRIKLFKKCILQGRMESRVMGIDSMQDFLVDIWTRYIKMKLDGTPHHVVVQYLSNYLLDNKIVDYLVGVESHPQLIYRSKNVVGFLVVTGKYGNKETDVIWNAVISSQDPRTVDAILDMVNGFLELSGHSILLYFLEKLSELPVRHMDHKMVKYAASLIRQVVRQWGVPRWVQNIDLRPYTFLIKLVCESIPEPALSISQKRDIWHFVNSELREILNWPVDRVEKRLMYSRCIDNIAKGTPLATGSIATLNTFLGHKSSQGDVTVLVEEFNFSNLLVDDLFRLGETLAALDIRFEDFQDIVVDRFSLLERVLQFFPDSISAEASTKLWTCMVGEKASSEQARDIAWKFLGRAANLSHTTNSFIERCLNDHLTTLDPLYLTPGSLDFATRAIEYQYRIMTARARRGEDIEGTAIGEILWQISLTVPDSRIGSKAISSLVRLNLDPNTVLHHGKGKRAEASAKFTERCIQELINAARDLKRLSDGTSSGEEDSMIIIASDRDILSVKLLFTRSFAILKEFMHGIRSMTPLSPASIADSHHSAESINGDEIRIQYQPHVGGKPTGIFTVSIGDRSTYADLITRLSNLTGFSEFAIYASGRKIDQAENAGRELREMTLLHNRMLLIQKAPGTKSIRGTGVSNSLLPLEQEIMKHFRDLYGLLGLEDELACEVCSKNPIKSHDLY